MLYAILFLKLWSYVQVNMWCRLSVKSKNTSQGRMRRQSFSYTDLHCKYIHVGHEPRGIDAFCRPRTVTAEKRLIPRYVNQTSREEESEREKHVLFSENILTLLKCERSCSLMEQRNRNTARHIPIEITRAD